ncbi:hypothetical protein MNBD_GAMMA09-157 [hydrothermal vent metagenome]|uniref:Serine aminopeptidase S33 domain-containing protein n=1 Tax=hydrothermal vent metagenome TaxID=652676 RepID=A0A3B0XWJ5_9ZZZZ
MTENYKIQSRRLKFEGFDGSSLAASLDYPHNIEPLAYVILAHCFTCNKQTLTTARLSRGLVQAGFAVLRFDFTGLGESEGDFAETHFRSMVRDIECAAAFLSDHYQPVSILMGHSMGGTACLAASQNGSAALMEVNRIVTLASPASPAHVLHHFGPVMDELLQGRASEIMVAGNAYPVRPEFVQDVQSYDMKKQMQACEIPIMAVRAGSDLLIGPESAEQILKFTGAQRKLLQIDGADHLFSNRQHAAHLLSEVLGFL